MSRAYSPKKIAELEADAVFQDKETGYLKVHNNSVEPVAGEKIYFWDMNSGKKSDVFDFASDFHEGLAFVGLRKKGFGYINTDFEFVIEPVYEDVSPFENGIAKVYRDGKEGFINRSGEFLFDPQLLTDRKYSEIGDYTDGLCMVSAMPVLERDFVSRNHGYNNPGIWGFIDTKGEEAVKPQYVFAENFQHGTAIAAKGEWVFDPEDFIYTPNDVRWGVIDKNGNEVVEFKYSCIRRVSLDGRFFAVCCTVGEKEVWGVADSDGNLLIEPKYKKIVEVHDGLAIFVDTVCVYNENEYDYVGVYDINNRKVIIEPKYSHISFEENGYFKVLTNKKRRSVVTLIDRDDNEIFDSEFTSIVTWCYPYLARIGDVRPMRYGFVDRDGKILFVSPEGAQVHKLNWEKRRAVYDDRKTLKRYLCDMDGNELTEHIYHSITGFENPLLTVAIWGKGGKKVGLIDFDGNTVVDLLYDRIEWLNDNSGYIADTGRKKEIFKL